MAEPYDDDEDEMIENMPSKPSKEPLKVILLHGLLDIWIQEAKHLPNMDGLSSMFNNKCGGRSKKNTSDPYVAVKISKATIARTFVIQDSENPKWMQHFNVPVAHYASELYFLIKDSDVVGSEIIGVVGIPVDQICWGRKYEGTFPILNASGKPCRKGAALTASILYTSNDKIPLYSDNVGSGPDYPGVPGTYFPLRKGGKVNLYQDAHVPDSLLPTVKLDNDIDYVHGKCWRDIFSAIGKATRLVYITGWSVVHKVSLVRDDDSVTGSNLGELLKIKSQEGVRVLLLVWDDPTSTSIMGVRKDGIMDTNDEQTRRFFKNSSVKVLLCPRLAGKGHSWAQKKEVGTIYTHHQKTVILDADAGGGKRKIIAFVGGLDLCTGRYDCPEHPIFRTLNTFHKDDYHNPNFIGSTVGCPREPWHDLHSLIDGPAARDILTNFEERWGKASKPRGVNKIKKQYDDSLLKLGRIPDIIDPEDALDSSADDDTEAWHVQVFRSIDSSSVKGFPKDPKIATGRNLVCGKNVLIDMSIHTAYVKAIRAAQHFIYIENQYFIGSSYNWAHYRNLGANNLIPIEVALKIASKIKANERFCAYIVIPMWPEGVPASSPTQRILFWQNNTMQMMYDVIYKALVEAGLENEYEPQDYLNFFCLGTRDAKDVEGIPDAGNQPANSPQALAHKNRRFMIYVHSKGMIVDDEFVILGSANINQRSLEGTRDTEIAMGAYQPHYSWASKNSSPRGQVYGYRMSLWAEHIGGIEEYFEQPESLECVRNIRLLSEQNWRQFAAEEATTMKGHLLKYPVVVDRTGKVKPIPGCESFPDVGGNIVGTFVAIQENLTI